MFHFAFPVRFLACDICTHRCPGTCKYLNTCFLSFLMSCSSFSSRPLPAPWRARLKDGRVEYYKGSCTRGKLCFTTSYLSDSEIIVTEDRPQGPTRARVERSWFEIATSPTCRDARGRSTFTTIIVYEICLLRRGSGKLEAVRLTNCTKSQWIFEFEKYTIFGEYICSCTLF